MKLKEDGRIQCPAITRKGAPCSVDGEVRRKGWCHVHDPNGVYQGQMAERRKTHKKKTNSRKKARELPFDELVPLMYWD